MLLRRILAREGAIFVQILDYFLQWRSKGGKWGHAPWDAGLGGATAHFLQSF